MGMGPWAQGDLIRDIEKAERARFRNMVRRELRAVEEANARTLDGGEQAFHRMLAKITPKKPKAAKRVKSKGYVEAEMGF